MKSFDQTKMNCEEYPFIISDFSYNWEMWQLPDGSLPYISPSCERITGYSAGEFRKNPVLLKNIIVEDDRAMYEKHVSSLSSLPDDSSIEYRIHHKDGRVVWLNHICTPVFDQTGQYQGRRISNCDFTERKQVDEALKENEIRFQELFNHVPDAIVTLSTRGIVTSANKATEMVTRLPNEETIGKHFSELSILHKEDITKFTKIFRGLVKRNAPERFDIRYNHKEKGTRWAEIHVSLRKQADRSTSLLVIIRDITRRKQAEIERDDTEKKYRVFVEQSPVITYIVGDGQESPASYISPQIEAVLGFTPEEWMAQPGLWEKLLHPEDRDRVLAESDLSDKTGERFISEYRIFAKNGDVFWLHDESVRICNEQGKLLYVQGIETDITKRMQADGVIKNTEQRLRNIVEHSNNLFYSHTPDHVLTYVSPQSRQFFGCEPEEAMVRWTEFMTENPINQAGFDATQRAIDTGIPQPPYELELKTKDGRIIWVNVNEAPVVKDGQTVSMVGALRDITLEKQAMDKIQKTEQRYHELFDEAPSIYVVTQNQNGNPLITDCNASFLKTLGYKKDEVIGQPLADFYSPSSKMAMLNHGYETSLEGKLPQVERELLTRDGHTLQTLLRVVPITDESDQVIGTRAMFTDITGQKQIEKTLLRQVQELTILQKVSNICVQSTSEDELIARVTSTIGEMLYTEQFGVLMVNETTQSFVFHPSFHFGHDEISIPANFLLTDGISGQVLASGKAMNYGDVRKLPEYVSFNEEMRSILCVPIKNGKQPVGIIHAESPSLNFFKQEDERLLTIIGEQMGIAIEKMRLFDRERAHRRETNSLRQTASTLTSSMDINEVLESLLTLLEEVVPYHSCAIFIFENDHLRILAGRGFSAPQNVIGKEYPVSDSLFQRLQKTMEPVIIPDVQFDVHFQGWGDTEITRGWMGVPIIVKDNLIGFITIDSQTPDTYTDADAELALSFARQAGSAIENARLFDQTEKQLKRLEALRKIDMTISSTNNLQVSLDVLLELVVHLQNVDAANVLLVNSDTNLLEYAAGVGFSTQGSQHKPLKLGEGLAGQAVMSGNPIFIPDLSQASELIVRRELVQIEGFHSYAAVSLISRENVLGVLEVFHRERIQEDSEWLGFLEALAGQASIAIDNARAFDKLTRANQDLVQSYNATIEGWASALEYRDDDTEGHSQRVTKLALRIAQKIGLHGDDLVNFKRGALLHDIGKIGIPDSILHKPGPLTDDEWAVMRQHPLYSLNMLSKIPFLENALDIPLHHHEKWDGSGYPDGLQGKNIPLAARIFAFADVFDALTSDRPYRKAWVKERALSYIKEQAGIHFDPELVSIVLDILKDI